MFARGLVYRRRSASSRKTLRLRQNIAQELIDLRLSSKGRTAKLLAKLILRSRLNSLANWDSRNAVFVSDHKPGVLSPRITVQNVTDLIFVILILRILFSKLFVNFADTHLRT